jgi:membrane protein required for colicin V production
MLSSRGYPYVAHHLSTFIAHPWLRQAVGFALIFLATVCVYVLIAALLHRFIKAAGLSFLDRFLGGLFGTAKVGVIIAALCLVAAQFFPPFTTRLATDSRLAPVFFRTAILLSALLPESVSEEFRAVYRDVYRQLPSWLPAAPVVQPSPPPKSSATPPPGPPAPPPDNISEQDAKALEKILRQRLEKQ